MPKWISAMWSEDVTDSESETFTKTIAQTLTRLYLHHPAAFACSKGAWPRRKTSLRMNNLPLSYRSSRAPTRLSGR